jgi:hypothetical protein
MRNVGRGLAIAAIAGLFGTAGLAQTKPDFSTVETASLFLKSSCTALSRVSEIDKGARVRKLLGKPTDAVCQDAVERWAGRAVDSYKAKDSSGVLRAMFAICGEIAEKLAGRPVEIFSCTSWSKTPGPPEEIWTALDSSPVEGIGVKQSPRDEALRAVFERRLSKDWDQLQVKSDMEGIGFVCERRERGNRIDITNATPRFNCRGDAGEMVGAPGRPLFLFGLQVSVTVTFAESGEPRGWQQIEVKTGEGHL